MNLPFQQTWLIHVGFVLLLIVSGFVAIFIFQRLWDFFRPKGAKKHEKEGCFGCLFKFIFLFFWFYISTALIAFSAYIQSFEPFPEKGPLAEFTCERTGLENDAAQFIFKTQHSKSPQKFFLRGDKWIIKGDILIFKYWMYGLGIKPMYRFTEVIGIESNYGLENIISLVPQPNTSQWLWFFKFGSTVPIIKETKADSILCPSIYNQKFLINASSKGFHLENVYE